MMGMVRKTGDSFAFRTRYLTGPKSGTFGRHRNLANPKNDRHRPRGQHKAIFGRLGDASRGALITSPVAMDGTGADQGWGVALRWGGVEGRSIS